ncbi:MAG: NnrS family protein [Deltaproteobacteria bacterium]|nr:NnrS family protein [Deltaproteobacteria bacterium]
MRPLALFGEPPPRVAPAGGAWAGKGFRPFFLLAGLFAALLVPIWLLALSGLVRPDAYFDATSWHAHEMVFGLATAVIAGFLLTAVSNWTARETLVGPPLLALAALWTAARASFVVPGLPRAIPALLDVAFLPLLALAIARPLVSAKNRRNYAMVGVLLALACANAVMHLDVLGVLPGLRRRGALFGVDLVVLLIVVISGRVVPMFTKNATGVDEVRADPRLERLAIATTAAVALLDVAQPDGDLVVVAAGAAALATAVRLVHWSTRKVWRVPLLWVLHLGCAFVPLGLALRVASRLLPTIPPSLATHALTVGAIGTVVLGMMARVSLGHTGRALEAGRAISVSFALVVAAAVVRALGPLVDLSLYRTTLYGAGSLWTAAFAIFSVVYAPILLSPRRDGKPG